MSEQAMTSAEASSLWRGQHYSQLRYMLICRIFGHKFKYRGYIWPAGSYASDLYLCRFCGATKGEMRHEISDNGRLLPNPNRSQAETFEVETSLKAQKEQG